MSGGLFSVCFSKQTSTARKRPSRCRWVRPGATNLDPHRDDPCRPVALLARNMDLQPFIGQAASAKILSSVICRTSAQSA